jgi:hypothetical protein
LRKESDSETFVHPFSLSSDLLSSNPKIMIGGEKRWKGEEEMIGRRGYFFQFPRDFIPFTNELD